MAARGLPRGPRASAGTRPARHLASGSSSPLALFLQKLHSSTREISSAGHSIEGRPIGQAGFEHHQHAGVPDPPVPLTILLGSPQYRDFIDLGHCRMHLPIFHCGGESPCLRRGRLLARAAMTARPSAHARMSRARPGRPPLSAPPLHPELALDLPIGTGKKLWIATNRAVVGLAAMHRMSRGFAMIRSRGRQ